ncbi:hypothetical protein C1H46_038570 [Malus baccata]|uniref:Uncharacterized protein n=1 Tax=Malus baccata TaxID=106549 RepID=A0A540KP09_MALBA|nr:hypothetical protein C1H46_038570 [Malus baccata]
MESATAWVDTQDWEVYNDDNFIFKRKKRRRVDPDVDSLVPAPLSSSTMDLHEGKDQAIRAFVEQLSAMEERARQLQRNERRSSSIEWDSENGYDVIGWVWGVRDSGDGVRLWVLGG